MELKQYQTETLAVLRRFLETARLAGPKNAYETITQEPEQAQTLGSYARTYKPLQELPNVPYVCLRLPTGGGKTILGAYAVAVARDAWIEKDYPVVLWLVPSNTIQLQTVDALKNTQHPYRQALDEAFDGRVRVFSISDFTHIRPHDLRDHCCIVVGTIQAFRVTNTEGRKVYAHHEELEPHFSAFSATALDLEKLDNGKIKFSFANLLHVHCPLMIVDEAHNAVTGLTREMQKRINPCTIIEFTATPRGKGDKLLNNILHNVTAMELKREEMIKLPVILSEHETWQNAVNGAVITRNALARTAQLDADYIRPIVLFQAQPRDQEVTVDVLKEYLMNTEQIPEIKIAIATGDQRQLDDIDLFSPECLIEYVITVEALKEGWDCSFAYVFCSVSRIHSSAAVEQLLGRVLRMPFARRRKDDALNKAYAHLSEPSFSDAARALTDKLITMGFEEYEAEDNIQLAQANLGLGDSPDDLFTPQNEPELVFKYTITATPEVMSVLQQQTETVLTFNEANNGKVEIVVMQNMDDSLEKAICEAVPEKERGAVAEACNKYRAQVNDQLSPAKRGELFEIPRLMSAIQEEFKFADTDIFMESRDWSLLKYSPRMDKTEFTIRETAHNFEIDIDGQQVKYKYIGEEEQLALNINMPEWTPQTLVLWLDKEVHQPDMLQSELIKWLTDLVNHLLTKRKIHLSALMRCKFILARKIRDKIAEIRQKERYTIYQQHLFSPDARVAVSFDHGFSFTADMYQGQKYYRGAWKPKKHFLGPNQVPAFDGEKDGEETQCAKVLDSINEVKFWIRNVSKHPQSFWLPTTTYNFYPDFVARLEDGRLFVVEYKGDHLLGSPKDNEKQTIGELWQNTTNGKGLFITVGKNINGQDVREQLTRKISGD